MKKFLILLLTVSLSALMLFACGGGDDTPACEHKDKNDDKKCDVCEAAFRSLVVSASKLDEFNWILSASSLTPSLIAS